MSIIKKAENYISTLAPHIKKREAATIIIKLINELEKQVEVIDTVNYYINNLYVNEFEGDLMRFDEMKRALASLEKDND